MWTSPRHAGGATLPDGRRPRRKGWIQEEDNAPLPVVGVREGNREPPKLQAKSHTILPCKRAIISTLPRPCQDPPAATALDPHPFFHPHPPAPSISRSDAARCAWDFPEAVLLCGHRLWPRHEAMLLPPSASPARRAVAGRPTPRRATETGAPRAGWRGGGDLAPRGGTWSSLRGGEGGGRRRGGVAQRAATRSNAPAHWRGEGEGGEGTAGGVVRASLSLTPTTSLSLSGP